MSAIIFPYEQSSEGRTSDCHFLLSFADTTNWKNHSVQLEFFHQLWKWRLTLNWQSRTVLIEPTKDCDIQTLQILLGDDAYSSKATLKYINTVFFSRSPYNLTSARDLGFWDHCALRGSLYIRVILEAQHFYTLKCSSIGRVSFLEGSSVTLSKTEATITEIEGSNAFCNVDRVDLNMPGVDKQWKTVWAGQASPSITFPCPSGNSTVNLRVYVQALTMVASGRRVSPIWSHEDGFFAISSIQHYYNCGHYSLRWSQQSSSYNTAYVFLGEDQIQKISDSFNECYFNGSIVQIRGCCLKRNMLLALKDDRKGLEQFCLHRERVAVEKIKRQAANDLENTKRSLRAEYERQAEMAKTDFSALLSNVERMFPDNILIEPEGPTTYPITGQSLISILHSIIESEPSTASVMELAQFTVGIETQRNG
eukprot:GILK01012905.1.p1 GENE.GILK01012905.1~~GILK01012905.1.p1  ORF type:complete len:423 (+),score=19.08 GILK01012905.1:60-1328(+)